MSAGSRSYLGYRRPLTIGAQFTNRWVASRDIDPSTAINPAVPLAELPADEVQVYVHRKTVLPSASRYTLVRGDAQGLERIKAAFVQEEIKRNPLVAKHPMRIYSDQMSEPLHSTADLERASLKTAGREVHLYYRLDTSRSADTVQAIQASVQNMRPAPLSRQQREMVESASRAREKAMHISAAITAPVQTTAPVSWKQMVCDNIGAFVQTNPRCSDEALHHHVVGELMNHSSSWAPISADSNSSHMIVHTPSTAAGMAAVDLVNSVRSLDMARVGGDARAVRRAYASRLERSVAWHGLAHLVHADPHHRHPRHHHRHYHVRHGKHDRYRDDHPHPQPLQRGARYMSAADNEMVGVRDYTPAAASSSSPAYRRPQPRRVQTEMPASVAPVECRGIARKNKDKGKAAPSAGAAAAKPVDTVPTMAEIEDDDSHLQRTAGAYRPLPETDMIGKRMWGSACKGHTWALNESGTPASQHINGLRSWYANKKASRRAKKQAKADAAAAAAAAAPPADTMMNVEASQPRSRTHENTWSKVDSDMSQTKQKPPQAERSRSRSRSRSPPRSDAASGQWQKVNAAAAAAVAMAATASKPAATASKPAASSGQWNKVNGGAGAAPAATARVATSVSPAPAEQSAAAADATKAAPSAATSSAAAAAYEMQPIEKKVSSSTPLSKKLHVGVRNAMPTTRPDLQSQVPLRTTPTQALMGKPAGTTPPKQAAPKQAAAKQQSQPAPAAPASASAATAAAAPATMPKAAPEQQQQQQADKIEGLLGTPASEFNLNVTNHATVRRNINGTTGVAPPEFKNFSTVIEVGYYVALPLGISRENLPKGPWTRVGIVNPGETKTFRLKLGPAYSFVFVDKFDGTILNVVPFQDQRSGTYTITVNGKDDRSEIKFRYYSPKALTNKGTAFLRQRLPMGINGSIIANGTEYKLSEQLTQVPVGIHTLRCTFDDPSRAPIISPNSVILSEDTRYVLKNVGNSVLVRVEDDFGPEKLAKFAPGVKPVANSIVFVNPLAAEVEFAPIAHFMPKKQGSTSQHLDDDYVITTNKGTEYPINPSHAHIWDINNDKVPVLATFAHPDDQSCTVMVVERAKLVGQK